MKNYILFLLICTYIIIPVNSSAQNHMLEDIKTLFTDQLVLFPQEKIYVQIDKPYYITGEDLWFRAHLVQAHNHYPDSTSRYIYGELIDPLQQVVKRIKVKHQKGIYHGHLLLTEDLPEGDYQLRFYTKYMRSLQEDFFFKRSIRIGSPLSIRYRTESTFAYDNQQRKNVEIEIRIKELSNQEQIKPDNIEIKNQDGMMNNIPLDTDGIARLKIKKSDIPSALYIEYTYKGRTQKQFLNVYLPSDDYDVSFYPEGGQLVENAPNRIAFKAVNTQGLGEKISGFILNQQGDTIHHFESSHLGMGSFFIPIIPNTPLFAVCRNEKDIEKKIPLPVTKGDMSLQVYTLKEQFRICVLKSPAYTIQEPLYLVAHSRGIIAVCSPWDTSRDAITVRKDQLPAGILQFLLVDKDLNPISERMVFNNDPAEQANISFSTNKPVYSKREKIEASFSLSDIEGEALPGNFSIAVTDDKDIQADTCMNILTSLLLTSELRGHVETPSFYFNKENPKAGIHLDDLLLTQGWTRYDINKIMNGTPEEPTVEVELFQEITGIVKGGVLMDRPAADYPVSMLSVEHSLYDETITDKEGRFRFGPMELPDSINLIIQGKTKGGGSRVELAVDKESFPGTGSPIPLRTNETEAFDFEEYLKKANEQYSHTHGMRMIDLDEIVITASEVPKPKSIYAEAFKSKITSEVIEKTPAFDIYTLLKRFPEVEIKYSPDPQILIRRSGSLGAATLILHDIPVDISYISHIDVDDVDEIGIITGAMTTILGGRGGGSEGAIVISTKRGLNTEKQRYIFNLDMITPLGYQITKEFYSPVYNGQEDTDYFKPDLRSTIYWNPNIQTTGNGKADISFYAADASTTYSVVIEGVTPEGILIHSVQKIQRNE